MALLDTAIWWHVYPLGALGAPHGSDEVRAPRPPAGFEAWLDHAVALGCNGLLLGPIFHSRTHGYDTLDHFRIDPRVGDDADVDRLVAACRERGLGLLLDGVFNHVAREHPLVTERPDMVRHEDGRPRGWEGHDALVELDHANPDVRRLVVDVMRHWLGRGITGWRLDVAYAVPTDVWAQVIDEVRADFPDAVFLGEVIHGDYPRFVAESHVDTVTQYELWKAIRSSITDANPWELAHALERHAGFCRHFVPQTFVGNHDVTRIATAVGADGAALAAGVLLSLPGSPSIYYGDEDGFTGEKREEAGGDDDIRPALPTTPGELSPLGRELRSWHQELIGFRRRHAWLATGRLTVTHKDEDVIDYSVAGPDAAVHVHLDLRARRIAVVAPDEELHRG